MNLDLEAINKHCEVTAAREALSAKHNELKNKYSKLNAGRKPQGKTVKSTTTTGGQFVVLFTDGTYMAIEDERDSFGEFDVTTLSLEAIRQVGLMEDEDKATLDSLKEEISKCELNANYARTLKNVIQHFGIDKIRELVNEPT